MIHSRNIVFQKRMIVIAIVIVKVMMKKNKFLSTYCDDPDKEYCVPEKDDQHRQLHHPEVQELLLFGKETILEYGYFDIC